MTVETGLAKTRVVIVGAGFAGLGLGIKLKESGLNDFVILEKSDSVGGVWHANRYPGAACDVPSHLYSYSFDQSADWPDRYAKQPDILDYLRQCARKYGLESHIRLGTEVTEARWDEESRHWIVQTSTGLGFEAQSLVAAAGQLSRPFTPRLPGLADFRGATFHSAEWKQGYDLSGKSVAIIGSGASAVQIIPAIAAQAGRLYVFQRSAAYVLPKPDKVYPEQRRRLFRRFPSLLKLDRAFLYLQHEMSAFAFVTWRAALRVKRRAFFRNLERGIKDPDLRRRLTPDYRLGCKRILLSNEYYPAMQRPNVELVSETIQEIAPDGIITADAARRNVDCIIFATGFTATDFLAPMKIIGLRGHDLRQDWHGEAAAYLGMTVAGFPNFFMLYGPNTNLAHNSIVYMIEGQIGYIVTCLARLCRNEIRSLEIRKEIQDRFNAGIQRRLQRSTWSKGCTSWYLAASGKNTTNWPGYSFEFRSRTSTPDWKQYRVQ